MPRSFSATVSDWVKDTKERQQAVYIGSVQRLLSIAQEPVGIGGNMPIDTGFLRSSLVTNLGTAIPTMTFKPEGEQQHSYEATAVNLTIANAKITDPIVAAWTANYAVHQEYGARSREGRRFVGLAAQRWQEVVNAESAELQRSVGRR
nr:hypothetical protein [Brevundimonas naejangsanensis]